MFKLETVGPSAANSVGVERRWEALNKTPYRPLPITDLDLIADLDHLRAKFFLSFHCQSQISI